LDTNEKGTYDHNMDIVALEVAVDRIPIKFFGLLRTGIKKVFCRGKLWTQSYLVERI